MLRTAPDLPPSAAELAHAADTLRKAQATDDDAPRWIDDAVAWLCRRSALVRRYEQAHAEPDDDGSRGLYMGGNPDLHATL